MRTQLKPCKCGKPPAVVSPDVCEDPIYYARCKCGMASKWRLTVEQATKEWNETCGVDRPKCARARSVLARRKEAYGCV